MKMMMLASVASMIDQFNMPNIKMLLDMGYKVDVACNFIEGSTCSQEKIEQLKRNLTELGVNYYQIDFSRDITKVNRIGIAYRQVKKLMKKNAYSFVHCHSPIGGLIARMAGKATKTRVIYTAHGFHFYRGAPLMNWLIYYPVEWLFAHWTDTLITINQEDYALAQKHMHAKKVVYVPGTGIDLEKFGSSTVNKAVKRRELGVPENATLLLSVGELNNNKNHETVIKAIKGMDVYYIIAGIGEKKEYLQQLIDEQGMTERIKLLGFRKDVKDIYSASDIFVFPSFREGLSVALMEAMASGLPCVVSQIRGSVDLIDINGGLLFDSGSIEECSRAIAQTVANLSKSQGAYNKNKIVEFGINSVLPKMQEIYSQ